MQGSIHGKLGKVRCVRLQREIIIIARAAQRANIHGETTNVTATKGDNCATGKE